jgi:hypothetical protein
MSNLTGQAIQNTYPGLLNLATATTGVTSTPQQIQDGLGNNTGTKIATDWLTNPMVLGTKDYKADYYGLGFSLTGPIGVANSQNVMIAQLMYDNGTYDYSAMTYNVITATTSTDVITCGFYTSQYVDGVGLAPYQLIQSGITLTSTPIGIKTTTLPSTLSFSAYGPGYYFWVYKISNAGVTPTTRLGASINSMVQAAQTSAKLGFTLTTAGTSAQFSVKGINQPIIVYSGLTNFQTSYSEANVKTFSTTVAPSAWGFVLNTIK